METLKLGILVYDEVEDANLVNAIVGKSIITKAGYWTRIWNQKNGTCHNGVKVAYYDKNGNFITSLNTGFLFYPSMQSNTFQLEIEAEFDGIASDEQKMCVQVLPVKNEYKEITRDVINSEKDMIIICPFGVNDIKGYKKYWDENLFKENIEIDNRFIFVLESKAVLDIADVKKMVKDLKCYLNGHGIKHPRVIAVDARSTIAVNIGNERAVNNALVYKKGWEYTSLLNEDLQDIIEKKLDDLKIENKRRDLALLYTGISILKEVILDIIVEKEKNAYSAEKPMQINEELNLISSDFFPKGISIDVSRVFPMMVLATMSSGKSTLINALLEKDILPSRNEACTAKVYSILDDDTVTSPKVFLTHQNGDVEMRENNLSDVLELANDDNDIRGVFVSGEVKGVLNTDRSLLIIDTPGPNNSRDNMHGEITDDILNKLKGGLILYVVNATQMGINDDSRFLKIVKACLDKNENIEILFVINKMDAIDFERESVSEIVMETKAYIENHGIKNPNIIPVSAMAAGLFKKVLAGESLTRSQYRNFLGCYDLFKTSDLRLVSYALTEDTPNRMETITVRGEEYTVAELMAAIENTGITYLEKKIQNAQILSSKNLSVKFKLRN